MTIRSEMGSSSPSRSPHDVGVVKVRRSASPSFEKSGGVISDAEIG